MDDDGSDAGDMFVDVDVARQWLSNMGQNELRRICEARPNEKVECADFMKSSKNQEPETTVVGVRRILKTGKSGNNETDYMYDVWHGKQWDPEHDKLKDKKLDANEQSKQLYEEYYKLRNWRGREPDQKRIPYSEHVN